MADTEYDLAHGVIRLMRPDSCGKDRLAYWATDMHWVSSISIAPTGPQAPLTISSAYLNGERLRILFDTGTLQSALTREGSAREGISPLPSTTQKGLTLGGVGNRVISASLHSLQAFRIGDEVMRHPLLDVSDIDLPGIDMVIGVDFFLAHRIYVSNTQSRASPPMVARYFADA